MVVSNVRPANIPNNMSSNMSYNYVSSTTNMSGAGSDTNIGGGMPRMSAGQ